MDAVSFVTFNLKRNSTVQTQLVLLKLTFFEYLHLSFFFFFLCNILYRTDQSVSRNSDRLFEEIATSFKGPGRTIPTKATSSRCFIVRVQRREIRRLEKKFKASSHSRSATGNSNLENALRESRRLQRSR